MPPSKQRSRNPHKQLKKMAGLSFIGAILPAHRAVHGSFHGGRLTPMRRQAARRHTATPAQKPVRIESRRNSRNTHNKFSHTEGRRANRVAELLRREVGSIIDNAFARTYSRSDEAPPLLISVVDVKCSDDLRNARVNVSVFGSDEDRLEAITWLRKSRREIRFELAQAVKLKYIPELSFGESEMAAAVKTVDIINQIAQKRVQKSEVAVGDEAWTAPSGDLDYNAAADDGLIFEVEDDDDDDDDDESFIIDVEDEDGDGEDIVSESEFIERSGKAPGHVDR